MITQHQRETLINMAEAAAQNSYSPYSKFKVGAAILTSEGKFFSGCNVENISYGLTSCAERNTIFSAISQIGAIKIIAIAITTPNPSSAQPCGACRQVMAEFGNDIVVIYKGDNGYEDATLAELLPNNFSGFVGV